MTLSRPSEVQTLETARLLLVDDEQDILDMLMLVLSKEGFRDIQVAHTGSEALLQCRLHAPHLIVLDVMLPDMSGFDTCQRIRQFSDVPVLFLTAKSTDLDKLTGFGYGADDYITKPFNPLEVVARIKAHLRRHLVDEDVRSVRDDEYDFGHFRVLEGAGVLEVAGQSIPCPAREFQLLLFLCKHPNRVFSREQLYEQVWGEQSIGEDNTVMVHMRRLREKIERDPSNPEYLLTLRGLGYKLDASPKTGDSA